MTRLEGKVAIVTGGSQGLGEAIVREFVAQGAKVVIGDILEDKGQELANELGENATLNDVRMCFCLEEKRRCFKFTRRVYKNS